MVHKKVFTINLNSIFEVSRLLSGQCCMPKDDDRLASSSPLCQAAAHRVDPAALCAKPLAPLPPSLRLLHRIPIPPCPGCHWLVSFSHQVAQAFIFQSFAEMNVVTVNVEK